MHAEPHQRATGALTQAPKAASPDSCEQTCCFPEPSPQPSMFESALDHLPPQSVPLEIPPDLQRPIPSHPFHEYRRDLPRPGVAPLLGPSCLLSVMSIIVLPAALEQLECGDHGLFTSPALDTESKLGSWLCSHKLCGLA